MQPVTLFPFSFISESYCLTPQVLEPANDVVKAEIGESLSKTFFSEIDSLFESFLTSFWRQDVPHKGVWFE